MPKPIINKDGRPPIALGANAPTTNEPKIIFAPSRKKLERVDLFMVYHHNNVFQRTAPPFKNYLINLEAFNFSYRLFCFLEQKECHADCVNDKYGKMQ